MLVRINTDDVEIGMFIHAFEGSWFDHPFWRRHFQVETAEQVHYIRNSPIDAVVIDESRGRKAPAATARNRSAAAPRAKRASARRAAKPQPPVNSFALRPPRDEPVHRRSFALETRRARKLIERTGNAVASMFEEARLGRAIASRDMVDLARAVGQSIERDSRALVNLVRLKDKDRYTYLHSVAVCALMVNFARHLELDERIVEELGVAGLLHDIGKIAVSDMILKKPGHLSDIERDIVRDHPAAGHRLLAESQGVPDAALEVCLRHHERIDGKGYPDGLSGEQLSLFARMGAICDVYDAITSDRPYKDGWTPCEALTEMARWHGHFDEALLEKFADSLGIYPAGTLVRLSTGELGVVRESEGEFGQNLVVRVFFDCDALSECEPFDRIIHPSADNPRVIGRDSPGFWRIEDWDALRLRLLTERPPAAGPLPQ